MADQFKDTQRPLPQIHREPTQPKVNVSLYGLWHGAGRSKEALLSESHGERDCFAPLAMTALKVIFLVLGSFMMSSCLDPRIVIVLDHSGKSISGAVVMEQAMSIEGPTVITGPDGKAKLKTSVLGAKWLSVSKDGYITERIEIPTSWPTTIRLKKSEGGIDN